MAGLFNGFLYNKINKSHKGVKYGGKEAVIEFFKSVKPIKYEGKGSGNPFAFRFYNPEEIIAGKTMREQLRFAMSYWHTMCAEGTDMFGSGTIFKSYGADDPMQLAKKQGLCGF